MGTECFRINSYAIMKDKFDTGMAEHKLGELVVKSICIFHYNKILEMYKTNTVT